MKEVDVSRCEIVHAGSPWQYEEYPCSKSMIKLLERNERYCTWFQPVGKGVEAQFPAIEIRGKYYQLSLRVQKAIFRNTRLKREFCNIEYVADGAKRLRIPQRLLVEKKRTSSRFTVGPALPPLFISLLTRPAPRRRCTPLRRATSGPTPAAAGRRPR